MGPAQLERATRIELAFSAWEADVLPLNYARNFFYDPVSLVICRNLAVLADLQLITSK